MNPMKATEPSRHRAIGLWVVAGFVAGAIIRCASIWPDFFERLQWASAGGGGESASWGEPLFYMVLLGIPAGLIGGAIGFVTAVTLRRFTKRGI